MGKKRMGRPPAGPGGTKVEDLPRVTIRLEPELRRRALAHAKETGRPLWRLIQDLLREHLDRQAGDGEPPAAPPVAPPPQEPPAELAAAVEAEPREPLRRLELTYQDARLLFGVVRWRRELAAEPETRPEQRRALKALAALFAEQKPSRGRSAEDVWTAELPLERCRRLRAVVGEFLAARDERLEEEMRGLRAEWRTDGGRRMRPDEEQEHRKRIKRKIRAVNGKARRARKRIPWR